MLKEFMQYLLSLRRETVVEVDDRKFIDRGESLLPIYDPSFPQLPSFQTLTGLCDYLSHNPDALYQEEIFTVIDGFQSVSVVSTVYGKFKQRDKIAKAEFPLPGPEDMSGSVERMIVNLNTMFEESIDRTYLLNLISNLKIDDETRIEDDGMSQRVAVKTGVTTIEEKVVNPTVVLKPIVTFPEIDQPEITYYLRLQQNGNRTVSVYLYTQQGRAWQLKIAENIFEFLSQNLPVGIVNIR